MAPRKEARVSRTAAALCAVFVISVCTEKGSARPLHAHVAEHSHRHKRQLNGLFSSVLDGVKNLVNTGTSIAGLGTGMLNLGGDEGIGGVVSGMLNLLSIGSEIFTGILGTLLNGDLLGGLLPFFGGQG
ncbi:uncharacterized protein LOC119392771 [Rhipicephalus sanguineus]|uniref:uncharacterized protein LOC119392771 n=1 Tax=Rhipicephalus sanguineus TaxID=34632 RepID=UPI0018952CC6|nr:uncharacterized protein LOC119392771 [Rhipicephalus sanguineus]